VSVSQNFTILIRHVWETSGPFLQRQTNSDHSFSPNIPLWCAQLIPTIYKPNTLTLSYPIFMLSNRYTFISVTGKDNYCCRTSNTFELCFQILFFIYQRNWIWLLPLKSGRENRKLRSYRVSPHAYLSECVIEFSLPHMLQTINTLVPNLHLEPYPRMLQY